MKKYLVVGNPIDHSLSPKLHNYWIKKNKINAIYDKKKINEKDIKDLIEEVKNDKLHGINVTVPYKNIITEFVEELTVEANKTKSVNTIYKQNNKIIGHNTDAIGFELGLRYINYDLNNKVVLILGAGGVVPSVILTLKKMGASKIIVSNRTRIKAENLKSIFSDIEIVDWGKIPNFDMIINATILGLNSNDEIKLDHKKIENNKLFYDIIYNPKETKFLSTAKKFGNKIENGKMMFIYQAHLAFTIWHKVITEIDEQTINLLDQ